jgi:hypothetical protein
MNSNERLAAAKKAGRAAFHAGKLRVPALDSVLMSLIVPGRMIGDKSEDSAMRLMSAWIAGWDAENLK